MKKILLTLLWLPIFAFTQIEYEVRIDKTYFYSPYELKIEKAYLIEGDFAICGESIGIGDEGNLVFFSFFNSGYTRDFQIV